MRAVGPGAGNFTYFLIQDAGHFVRYILKGILYCGVETDYSGLTGREQPACFGETDRRALDYE